VVFYDPEVTQEQGTLLNTAKVSLDELLERSDFVTLHAPATEKTRHMMDGEAFAKMKEGAFFINTARASLVDEEALAEALESGQVAGAALDVFSLEPPASDNPIISRDNVIATPHIGGDTSETSAHQGSIVIEQLGKLVLGETPDHIMNPEVLEGFDWTGPRREPPQSELERLAGRPKPTISS
jgi:phosphoglycerate dehydrogenase-like enzyme